jgi:hypothetical protein
MLATCYCRGENAPVRTRSRCERAHAVEQIEIDVGLAGEANAVAEVVLDGSGILSADASRRDDDE